MEIIVWFSANFQLGLFFHDFPIVLTICGVKNAKFGKNLSQIPHLGLVFLKLTVNIVIKTDNVVKNTNKPLFARANISHLFWRIFVFYIAFPFAVWYNFLEGILGFVPERSYVVNPFLIGNLPPLGV